MTKKRKLTYSALIIFVLTALWVGQRHLKRGQNAQPLAIGVDGAYTVKKRMSKTQVSRLEKHMMGVPPAVQSNGQGTVHSQVEMINSINNFNQQQNQNK